MRHQVIVHPPLGGEVRDEGVHAVLEGEHRGLDARECQAREHADPQALRRRAPALDRRGKLVVVPYQHKLLATLGADNKREKRL
jgi:hypothetical protein